MHWIAHTVPQYPESQAVSRTNQHAGSEGKTGKREETSSQKLQLSGSGTSTLVVVPPETVVPFLLLSRLIKVDLGPCL